MIIALTNHHSSEAELSESIPLASLARSSQRRKSENPLIIGFVCDGECPFESTGVMFQWFSFWICDQKRGAHSSFKIFHYVYVYAPIPYTSFYKLFWLNQFINHHFQQLC